WLEKIKRRVAIKMLRPEMVTPALVERFQNEGIAANRVSHENVVDISDSGSEADMPFLVMEYLDGYTLEKLIEDTGHLPLDLLLHVFTPIARALSAVHANSIVHRDLKPANVFIVSRPSNPYFVKLLDFGIAQLRDDRGTPGQT